MNVQQIQDHRYIFSFDELLQDYHCVTNIFAAVYGSTALICDTYFGKQNNMAVIDYLSGRHEIEKYIVFNSHCHWDHVLGNGYYPDAVIIAHREWLGQMRQNIAEEIEYNRSILGPDDHPVISPTLLFAKALDIPEIHGTFFYSPGHTVDSASYYDAESRLLFAGDNVEAPIPSYLCHSDLDAYLDTLRYYKRLNPALIIQSHGPPVGMDILERNIAYLERVIDKTYIPEGKDELRNHESNKDEIEKFYAAMGTINAN